MGTLAALMLREQPALGTACLHERAGINVDMRMKPGSDNGRRHRGHHVPPCPWPSLGFPHGHELLFCAHHHRARKPAPVLGVTRPVRPARSTTEPGEPCL